MELKMPAGVSSGELEARKSRFIAELRPAEDEAQAARSVAQARARHPGARHCAWAFRLPGLERCSDDGEPSGTAGRPVLAALRAAGLCLASLTVARHFGGVLLGTGGLVRAYGGAAGLAVANARVVRLRRCARFRLACGYSELEPLGRLCGRLGGAARPSAFGESVELSLLVPEERADELQSGVRTLTRGRTEPKPDGFVMQPYPDSGQNG